MSQTVGASPALTPCGEIVNYAIDAGDLEADSSAHREGPRPNTRGRPWRDRVTPHLCGAVAVLEPATGREWLVLRRFGARAAKDQCPATTSEEDAHDDARIKFHPPVVP
jgi:hypothetical protein